jgi:uncharacterized protein YbjQ (UPF0145 family)
MSDVKYSGLSGNEMYCAYLLGFSPADLLIGNSVFSMGFIGSMRANVRTVVGGEIKTITDMISEGRRLSFEKLEKELAQNRVSGVSGVKSDLIFHPGNMEFLSVGSGLTDTLNRGLKPFTTSASAQELFAQWDSGYQPISFAFGNVAYSIGMAKGIMGGIKKYFKGEVKQYSDIFNTTRNLALSRIVEEARGKGANSVVGIKINILPLEAQGVQEMVMLGTASYNQQIASIVGNVGGVSSSNLSAEETWNITKLGYVPLKLLVGTSVYALGFVGGIKSAFANLVKGEINSLTDLIYGAREESIQKLKAQAEEIGADDVLGIKNYIYDLGSGMIEFLSIGTAIKKVDGLSTNTAQIPPQVIIKEKETFIDLANVSYGRTIQNN